jgi:hypothetical protein
MMRALKKPEVKAPTANQYCLAPHLHLMQTLSASYSLQADTPMLLL